VASFQNSNKLNLFVVSIRTAILLGCLYISINVEFTEGLGKINTNHQKVYDNFAFKFKKKNNEEAQQKEF